MITDFIAELAARLAVERQKSADLITGGRCSDFSEYRYSLGYMKALDDATLIATQVFEDMQKQ